MNNSKLKFVTLSKGIAEIKNLHLFIDGCESVTLPLPCRRISGVVGWGLKENTNRAITYARSNDLPYYRLEDGFIRSIGLGAAGVQPLSLVVDEVGIYYDARQPSRLEQLIIENSELACDAMERSRRCISAIRDYRLSKYNQNRSDPQLRAAAPKVLVIDQTQGDASVVGAKADQNTFVQMLRSAVEAHPDDTIWVKVHPDVVYGKKKGFLYSLPFEHPNVKLYAELVNPWDFLETTTHVYTVSSLMGFEALMAGAQVHCFGMPFYAGWGLTHDQQSCERRNQPRTLEQVFDAAYIQYARYVDPILGERCEIERIISYMSDQLALQANAEMAISLSRLSWWKQRWIGDYLQAWRFTPSANGQAIRWGRGEPHEACFCIEDGFIRSVGLGVHFNRPMSLVLDRTGIYFDATRPSDLETILNGEISPYLIERAERLLPKLLESGITKYNVGRVQRLILPKNRTIILVPGQVESDASILYGSPEVKTNGELLLKVRQENPEAFLIYKPHPDVVAGQRDDGRWECEALNVADLVVSDVSMDALLQQVDEVHTMTSLAGFEALLRGKAVTTYGLPFYAGWGLTQDKRVCERRQRQLTLYELIAGALILYPTYIDPISRQLCTVEQALERLAQMKSGELKVKDYKLQTMLALKSVKKSIQHFFKK
ncbi:capsular polysaccharide biosynthesis protein [Vibrio cholerae]|uniref:capsular polysaccharide biosynthesis protein n=1 Tax=Vibrio cholerae TaxID=666 RepID=UPI001AE68581|nr:capsular polysaccharide biosynthesis protein [Vibrio cholerae]EGQ8390578.1 capsular polysaccharide biosynthesis protein [Vibrio cholerae]EGR0545243.1 capsular polysaccharide biosynthesis protein [Vibrio cholerae]EGR0573161.1 capsular polysaccharide biosynthesis protein [Vibrio cholerae]EGR5459310.1 capsular polysaccharide biosynthesis protein [Vibrio cholerae]EKF9262097.1 capsular polysaccharide biosynthesis protein [Vibrio cholerae]